MDTFDEMDAGGSGIDKNHILRFYETGCQLTDKHLCVIIHRVSGIKALKDGLGIGHGNGLDTAVDLFGAATADHFLKVAAQCTFGNIKVFTDLFNGSSILF